MIGINRRSKIKEILKNSNTPISGSYLSKELDVSRQIIVQDIALLRAEGIDIIATPQGYIIPSFKKENILKIIPCIHNKDQIEEELKIIISLGGKVLDVMVEHPIYGEIKGMLMLKSFYDIEQFMNKLNNSISEPLLVLTGGVHLHTIEVENEQILKLIESELSKKGYLLDSKL